jgi:hypothetical protein
MTTFWLSFANKNEFKGVIVIDIADDEIGDDTPFEAAITKTIRLGINPGPGTSVQGQSLPPSEIPDRFKNRLLDQSEVAHLNATGGLLQ